MPTAGAGPGVSGVEVTDVQRSIFNAPAPGSSTTAAPMAVVSHPQTTPPTRTDNATEAAQVRGLKRPREEEEDSDSDVAMEEDSDDD